MGMKLTFLCCVAGELKDNIVGTTKNSRLFFYRAYEDQTIEDMKEDGFFNGAQELRVDDLILLYDPNTKNEFEMVRIESMQGTVKTKKVDLPDIKKIYQILKEHQDEIDHNAALIAELDADTVHKSDGIDTLYGRQTGNEFSYKVKNDFDGAGSRDNIPTTLGLAQSFETPLSDDNKGASMAEITKVEAKVNIAATSGNLIGSYWFGKTELEFTPPLPTRVEQNYFDFTTNTPYTANEDLSGWTAGEQIENPVVDSKIVITSKLWNIPEQEGQQGGDVYWSHIQNKWVSYAPKIISFESPNLTGIPTTSDITDDSPDDQIVNLKALRENSGKGASLPLLISTFSDHILNDVSWLRADTFSWQDGSVYQAAYQHLVDDLATAGAVQTETIEGIEISYEVATDGHRICLADQEDAVSQIYEATGVAWFYIVDTENARFKLPRTKFGFTGLRDTVGGYVEAGLPNITGQMNFSYGTLWPVTDVDGALYHIGNKGSRAQGETGTSPSNIMFDASRSSEIYGKSNTVQVPATQMYLYFYVGNFTQTAVENTAGITAETLNQKADTDLANVSTNGRENACGWIVPDYANAQNLLENGHGPHTAPSNGWIYVYGVSSGNNTDNVKLTIDGTTFSINGSWSQGSAQVFVPVLWPISKNSTFTTSGDIRARKFIPCIAA